MGGGGSCKQRLHVFVCLHLELIEEHKAKELGGEREVGGRGGGRAREAIISQPSLKLVKLKKKTMMMMSLFVKCLRVVYCPATPAHRFSRNAALKHR